MLYVFAGLVFTGCLIGYRKTPEHDPLTRLLFRLGMICGLMIAVLGYVLFNVAGFGGK